MIKEYRTIYEVVSPLMVVDQVEGVTYDELCEIQLPTGEVRHGKVLEVRLRQMRVVIENCGKVKENGQQVPLPIHPSNIVITKLKMDKHRKELIEKKKAAREACLKKLGRA